MRNIITLSLFFSLGFCGIANPAEQIGKTRNVKPAASGTVAGTLAVDSAVHAQETINTDVGGQAGLEFHDSSKLDVGPKSSVKLDSFVYNPNKGAAAITLSATKGSFRYITGTQGKGKYKIQTPYGTLGVRG